ncbi:hypothetical protein E2C01_006513 [Portunus trituberculatus]|uniref:Uncharacterized protein n=1 Tax=Portunus trituberculatus TaxID=210409 RepID=A0A5B7CWH4_PORTR|nr:hypothetical protein [Portunus trituberculatus]
MSSGSPDDLELSHGLYSESVAPVVLLYSDSCHSLAEEGTAPQPRPHLREVQLSLQLSKSCRDTNSLCVTGLKGIQLATLSQSPPPCQLQHPGSLDLHTEVQQAGTQMGQEGSSDPLIWNGINGVC